MKQYRLPVFLSIEAVLCAIGAVMCMGFTDVFSALIAFPFEQIGWGLRMLSRSGAAGNIAAWILYAGISVLPVLYLLIRLQRKRAKIEDGLLAILCPVLFAAIFFMINPGRMSVSFPAGAGLLVGKAFLGGTVYSVLAGYIVLRALCRFSNDDTRFHLSALGALLKVFCAILIFVVFGAEFNALLKEIGHFSESNTDGGPLAISYLFIVLQYIVRVLPHVFEIVIILKGLELLAALSGDPYGEETIRAARKTGEICRLSVIWIMLSQIIINLLQFILGSSIRSSHFTVSLPLFSVGFVLAAFLLSAYFEKGRALKEENDSFV